jgi:peptidoglycan hydrolase CwlO-like protein
MTEKSLVEQIQDTTKFIETLSAEQADLGKKMAIAADDADSASLISLKHRANDIPVELLATQIRLERLLLRRDEERLPELQAEVAKLAEPIEPMRKKISDLQVEFNIASGAVTNANEDLRQTRLEISERRRSIESLLAQARNIKITPSSLSMRGGV